MENRLSSSGIFSQDLRHWKSSENFWKNCKNKKLNLKVLKIESFSCRCSMILIGREEEIQTERKCQDTANMRVEQFEESGHSVFKGVSPLARGILRKKNNKGDHTLQVTSNEVTSLWKVPKNAQPAAGNSLREVQQNFETLGTEVQFTKLCKEAAFIHEVAVGRFYRTVLDVDDGIGDRTPVCREYTCPRADSDSGIFAAITQRTILGPMFKFTR